MGTSESALLVHGLRTSLGSPGRGDVEPGRGACPAASSEVLGALIVAQLAPLRARPAQLWGDRARLIQIANLQITAVEVRGSAVRARPRPDPRRCPEQRRKSAAAGHYAAGKGGMGHMAGGSGNAGLPEIDSALRARHTESPDRCTKNLLVHSCLR